MELRPYNLPESTMGDVEITPLWCEFIWIFCRIIARLGRSCLKVFGAMAGGSHDLKTAPFERRAALSDEEVDITSH